MKITDYMEINRLTVTALAAQCNLDYFQVYRIVQGKLTTLKNAYKIVQATRGAIGYDDLIPKKIKIENQSRRKSESAEIRVGG
jgi:predicted transcriptional regulator